MKSCVEPFDFETISFENALVVEATITNEFKHQEINLTRTFQFEEALPSIESNAEVKVVDNFNNTYNFQETTPGKYLSTIEFAAEADKIYHLNIITKNGKSYASESTKLPRNTSQISNINAIREFNSDGIEGISIYVDSFDPTGNSRFYRFEYEETYQVIAPYWSQFDSTIISDTFPFQIGITLRNKEEKICYNTLFSKGIIQTETSNASEDRVTQKLVRFILGDDFIIKHRYSILVKQHTQSIEAYNFYKTLNSFSNSESLLSQNQPGFINGNVFSIDNSKERILGFFDVASVSTKRLFFNFRDLFSSGFEPPYIVDCELLAPLLVDDLSGSSPLISVIQSGSLKYYLNNDLDFMPLIPGGGPHVMVIPECGDCTSIGSNIIPDFWID